MPFNSHTRVERIAPVDGWELHEYDYPTSYDTFEPIYFAVRGSDERLLQTSSYFFTPTQERFAWIVRHGFPNGVIGARGARGPLSDADIDEGILADKAEASARGVLGKALDYERVVENVCAVLFLTSGALVIEQVARAVL
jgi:hypothetical protein